MLGTLGQTPWSARDALVPQPEHSSLTGWFGAFPRSLTRAYSSDANHDRKGVVSHKRSTSCGQRHRRALVELRPAARLAPFLRLQLREDAFGDGHLRVASAGQQARVELHADVAFAKHEEAQEGPR